MANNIDIGEQFVRASSAITSPDVPSTILFGRVSSAAADIMNLLTKPFILAKFNAKQSPKVPRAYSHRALSTPPPPAMSVCTSDDTECSIALSAPPANTSTLVLITQEDNEGDLEGQLQLLPAAEVSDELVLAIPHSAPPLPNYILFVFLISPALKLGSMLVQKDAHSVGGSAALIMLAVFSLLSAFSSQIWVLMGRYLRKWTIEDVIAEAVVGAGCRRGGSEETWKQRIRAVSRVGLVASIASLCLAYLNESADLFTPLIPGALHPLVKRAIGTAVLSVPMLPVLQANSLASKPVIISTALSVISYITALAASSLASHIHGKNPGALDKKMLGHVYLSSNDWAFASTAAFAFSSSALIYPIYASRVAARTLALPISTCVKRRLPFPLLLLFSFAASLALVSIPFFVSPRAFTYIVPLHILSLLLGVPAIWAAGVNQRLPANSKKWCSPALWLILASITVLSTPSFSRFVRNMAVFCSLGIAYPLPAILHIMLHAIRPPLSILVLDSHDSLDVEANCLLELKERALQQKRVGKRLGWDLGVGGLLAPLGLIVWIWAGVRLIRFW
ncbi:hypothetical protein BOTBODRAFT_57685 [Botryobasidium botryosum FD-172 SS1]|uniref:Amino acid transporter transmembrane domain-containing protein n=1 Tax=Botryobasidium botryosum (strain FD-172 SS1) TaxID=930990 RepID=A0A067MGX9_BOTB1|nr:hypothetical protein BOTBODRAFT_57685 [Botryobasidium botryosum FD-172 SS1]